MLISELKQLQLRSETITIERDCSDDCLLGLISQVGGDFTAMHLFTDEGLYNGFSLFEIDQITQVYWGNREHSAIAHQISKAEPVTTPKIYSQTFQDAVIELDKAFDSTCFFEDGENGFDVGKIEKYDDEWIKIQTFSNKKSLSPLKMLILREEITQVVVNSPYQNQLVELHKMGL